MDASETISLSRVRADGSLIEFEQRPTGYRAYHFTSPGGERLRFPSVTTVIGQISPKFSLLDWYERKGAEGLITYRRERNARSIDGLPGIEE